MARYFRLPFAQNGDKNTLPDETPNSIVSYSTGYTQDYQRDPRTDPLARRMERDFLNQLAFDITDTLRLYYETGVPPFIAPTDNNGDPFPYDQYARVLYMGRIYESLKDSNESLPTVVADWRPADFDGLDARYYTRTVADGRFLRVSNNLSDLDTVATARTNLGLGTAALVDTGIGAGNVPTTTQADGRYLQISNNLSDLGNSSTARTNLGLGTVSVLNTGTADGEIRTNAQNNAAFQSELLSGYISVNRNGTVISRLGIFAMATVTREGTGLYTVTAGGGVDFTDYWFIDRPLNSDQNTGIYQIGANALSVRIRASGGRGVGDTIDSDYQIFSFNITLS